MASTTTGSFRTCPEGHPVLAVDLFCSTCGIPLQGKRSKAAAARVAKDAAERDSDDSAETDDPADEQAGSLEKDGKGLRNTILGASRATWIAVAMLVATVVMGVVVAITLKSGGAAGPAAPGPGSGLGGACDGVAQQEISLNSDANTDFNVLCFRVTEASAITLGAFPATPDVDLLLSVSRADGAPVASNDDAYGDDPEVTFNAEPGTYVATVTRFGGGLPGAITVYSAAVTLADAAANALPTLSDCASLSAPTIEGDGTGERTAGEPFTCVTLDAAAFTKIGAIADPASPTDLMIALYAYDESGKPAVHP